MSHLSDLGLGFDADEAQIRSAYRALVKTCHPDLHPGDLQAAERFRRITHAYECLIRELGTRGSPASGTGKPTHETSKPVVIRKTITLSVQQLFNGAAVQFSDVGGRCNHCDGKGHIPAGRPVDCLDCMGKGHFLRVKGLIRLKIECVPCRGTGHVDWFKCDHCDGTGVTTGGSGSIFIPPFSLPDTELLFHQQAIDRSGNHADLVVRIQVDDKRLKIDGLNVLGFVALHVSQILLGDTVTITLPNGTEYKLPIAPGTMPGSVVTISGEGLRDGSERGDYRLKIVAQALDVSNPKVRALLTDLRKL